MSPECIETVGDQISSWSEIRKVLKINFYFGGVRRHRHFSRCTWFKWCSVHLLKFGPWEVTHLITDLTIEVNSSRLQPRRDSEHASCKRPQHTCFLRWYNGSFGSSGDGFFDCWDQWSPRSIGSIRRSGLRWSDGRRLRKVLAELGFITVFWRR